MDTPPMPIAVPPVPPVPELEDGMAESARSKTPQAARLRRGNARVEKRNWEEEMRVM